MKRHDPDLDHWGALFSWPWDRPHAAIDDGPDYRLMVEERLEWNRTHRPHWVHLTLRGWGLVGCIAFWFCVWLRACT